MANAKRPTSPSPKDKGQPHSNMAPFSPHKLEEVAPGGSVSKKGDLKAYFEGGDPCEVGTGDAKPNWP